MRWTAPPAAALTAAAAWHLLGPAWAFTLLAAALTWAAGAILTAASEKAKTTENRVTALIPAVAGAKTTADAAKTTADAALPKAGGYVSGDLHITGTLYGAAGTLTVGDGLHVTGPSATIDGNLWIGDNGTACITNAKAQFLTGLRGPLWSLSGVAQDPWSGSAWANGERHDYINDLRAAWSSLITDMKNAGYMNG